MINILNKGNLNFAHCAHILKRFSAFFLSSLCLKRLKAIRHFCIYSSMEVTVVWSFPFLFQRTHCPILVT